MTAITLRDYQDASITGLRANIMRGIKNQILLAPTGAGKTVLGAYLLNEAYNKLKRAIFVCDRISLVNQTSATLDFYGIPHGILQGSHWRYRPWERIQVASAATLARRGWPEKFDLVIVDECFPGHTLISTPDGNRRIDTIQPGDLIYSAIGVTNVLSIFQKMTIKTVIVRLSDETTIECTEDHPIFTSMGWKVASSLAVGQELFCEEGVRALWCGNEAVYSSRIQGEAHSGSGNTVQTKEVLRSILRQEISEPDAFNIYEGKDVRFIEGDWTQAEIQRWKWNASTGDTGDHTQNIRQRLENGIGGENSQIEQGRIPASLQTGFSQSGDDDLHRAGWRESLRTIEKGSGCEKGRTTQRLRVEGIENIERESGQFVYNLRVARHPSYFANGVLVHNCHSQVKDTIEVIAKREVITIGLTATPFSKGLGKHYDAMVGVTTTNKLIKDKFLVPFRIFAASEPDMTGAKVVAGEWTENEAADRAMPIVGDCVAEYLKHGEGKKFIAFGCNVAHATELKKQFAEAGVMCELYTYKEGDEFRTETVDEFRKPDSYIRGLISVSALSKGFDVSDVEVIIMARPLKSSLAEHIQILGRGLRIHEGKKDCLILDHAGNCLRFWDAMSEFFESGEITLDMGLKNQEKKQPPKDKTVTKCPVCHHIHQASACPSCGHVPVKKSGIEHTEGSLSEMGGTAAVSKEVKQDFYSQLLSYAQSKGYASGWCSHQYKAKFGVFPSGMEDEPKELSMSVGKWIRSRQIAFSKAKAKAAA